MRRDSKPLRPTIDLLLRSTPTLLPGARALVDVGTRSGARFEHLAGTPLYVILLFDMRPAEVALALRALHLAQQTVGTYRILVFTDLDLFAAVRPYGWPVEHVVSERDWHALGKSGSWERHVNDSLAWVVRTYAAHGIVGGFGPEALCESAVHAGIAPEGLWSLLGPVDDGSPDEVYPTWRAWGRGDDGPPEGPSQVGPTQTLQVELIRGRAEPCVMLLVGTAPVSNVEHAVLRRARERGWTVISCWGSDARESDLALAVESISLASDDSVVRVVVSRGSVEVPPKLADFALHLSPTGDEMRASIEAEGVWGEWVRCGDVDRALARIEHYADSCLHDDIVRSPTSYEPDRNYAQEATA